MTLANGKSTLTETECL